MKTIKIFLLLCLLIHAFPALSAQTTRGEVLAVFRTPEGMTLTEQSLKDGPIRKYLDTAAASSDAKISNMFDSFSLMNKEGNIFVFITSDTKTTEELIASLKANPNVISVSPNRQVRVF